MSQIQTLQPAESRLYDFDFTRLLGTGESLASVISTTQQEVDTSTTPHTLKPTTDLTFGVPAFSGAIAQIRISTCLAGKRYKVEMNVTTTGSNTLQLEGFIQCKDL